VDLTTIKNDFSDQEKKELEVYVQNGCIGLDKIIYDQTKIESMFGLYMSGKTYNEISRITRVKRDIVLYMAAKLRWYDKRTDYLEGVQKEVTKKLISTKIESVNFITDLITAQHKYYGNQIEKFLETGDRSIIDSLDLKQLSQYFKSLEVLEKLVNPSNVKTSGPTINVNSTDTEVKVKGSTVEINPNTKTAGILKALAELKKEKEDQEEDS
jgi:hypothetical protein